MIHQSVAWSRATVIAFLAVLVASALPAWSADQGGGKAEDNWPRFRGPNADGVAADDARLPDNWSKKDNVKWVFNVPGWGISSPIVWGDKVFLTTVVSDGEQPAPKKGYYLPNGADKPPKG